MPPEVLEVKEFEEVQLRVGSLIKNGELQLDERITRRGYLTVALRAGQLSLRADRFVGLIPVTADFSIRVMPRTNVSNLSYMLARSGVAPYAISGFSRGYLPRFESSEVAERIYVLSLAAGVARVLQRGLMKAYMAISPPPAFRGRLLASETVRRYRAKGVNYRHAFTFSTLSQATIENIALKEAIRVARGWAVDHHLDRETIATLEDSLSSMASVPDFSGPANRLAPEIGKAIARLPKQLGYYRDPLWTAYALIQRLLPSVDHDGLVSLDSLIIDVSRVFEAYTRRCLVDRSSQFHWNIVDGNLRPSDFFLDNGEYTVHPDIVVQQADKVLAVLDAKYKPNPSPADRYELLSFMDSVGVQAGGFICPAVQNTQSRYLGKTPSGKAMSLLRVDLGAADPIAEAGRLAGNVRRMIEGDHSYE